VIYHDDTTVNDLAWHPFNQNLLATALQNGEINLWTIPDEGLTNNLTKPTAVIQTGEKR
jgi:coronin-7